MVEWWTRLMEPLGSPPGRLIAASVLGGFGLWWMLPGTRRWIHVLGALLVVGAGLLAFSTLPVRNVEWESILFWVLSLVALSAGVMTVTSRSPVYSAIWFALVLLGVGGLFLINGAQFLGVATVAVYAGAIVVTFLFVLMLAQPEGHAFYDRLSWGSVPSLLGCFAGMGLAMLILMAVSQTDFSTMDVAHSQSGTDRAVLAEEHVAGLGGQLFTRHLIGVQLAGTLLMAALIGAVAMASHGSSRRERRQFVSGGGGGTS